MKKRKIFILLMISLLLLNPKNLISSKINLKKLNLVLKGKVGEGILNYPGIQVLGYNISAGDENFFYVYDSKGKFPFYAIDKKTLELKGFGVWGQGPGEIAQGSIVILSVTRSSICAYLPFGMKLLIFGKDLKFSREIKTLNLTFSSIFYMIKENEGLFIPSLPQKEEKGFGEMFRVDESGVLSPTFTIYGEYEKFSKLKPLKENPMLKRGPLHVDREGRIYFAHYYSSLIMGFHPDGKNIFINFSPRDIEIPKTELKTKGGIITGDPERCIQSYLSLSSDDKYLYGLFSGEEITMEKVVAFRTGKLKELHLGEGKIVDVFQKKDSSYFLSFELPVFATSIYVDRDNLYITTAEVTPCVMIFKKPKF